MNTKAPPVRWLSLSQQLKGHFPSTPSDVTEPAAHSRLFNRYLSWLDFNERVLSEAADPTTPPLERLRFLGIVSSNLDEFFMVRVAEIARIARRFPSRRFPDGLTAPQVLAQIRERVLAQKGRQAEVLKDVLVTLEAKGIQIHAAFEKGSRLDREILEHLPEIRFTVRRNSEAVPPLASDQIHVFVSFPGEYAIISIEDRESRLLSLAPGELKFRFVLLERWLCARAEELFPGRRIIEAFPFKIIRDADLRYHPDEEETLEEQIVEAVLRRPSAKAIRLEVDAPVYSEGAFFLATALGVDSGGLYRVDLPLDLRTLAKICVMDVPPDLIYPPVSPYVPAQWLRPKRIFRLMRSHDVLLHHPYDSFDTVVRFVAQAAQDPRVVRIHHTMYRTGRESPILEALKEAARRGKKVKVYVEIKARFDELNNVRWAEDLRRSGVHVIRPLGRFKAHCKMTQVVRNDGGQEVSYLHLGTGNYHPGTARQYTDLGLLTRDPGLGRDAGAYFSALTRHKEPAKLKYFLVAPGNLDTQILRLIREETKIQRSGGRGHIIAKMNSLVDPAIIEALYDASQAGVRIELVVRGICCLRPGVKGMSENIRVVSIVDRFLEHSRIYYFRAGGAQKFYLSSADWMPRNFYMRYELAFPIHDPILKRYIREVILSNSLADNVKAWILKPDGTYVRLQPKSGEKPVRSQLVFEELARQHYRGTVLERRQQKARWVRNLRRGNGVRRRGIWRRSGGTYRGSQVSARTAST